MKLIKMMMIASLLFLFSGCTNKQVIFKDKLVCSKQLLVPKPKANIKVKKQDAELGKAYIEANNEAYRFYENQVLANNEMCVNVNKENEDE